MTSLRVSDLCESVIEDFARYKNLTREQAVDQIVTSRAQQVLADAWRERDPETPEDVDQYYRGQEAYVHDLVWFNAQPSYWLQNVPLLEATGRVADFGGGIGSLALVLNAIGCTVFYVDLPSPQRTFAEWRFGHFLSTHTSLTELHDLDVIVSTDTIEHLHPSVLPEIAQQMWDSLKPTGEVRTISKFGTSDVWPMHYDSEPQFKKAMNSVGFEGGCVIWTKRNGKD